VVPWSARLALVHNGFVDAVHIAGSTETYDQLVWGSTDAGRPSRRDRREPVLEKPVTSLLEGVCPVMVVPCLYARDELEYLAARLASEMGAFSMAPRWVPRLLVLPAGWLQRDLFLDLLEQAISDRWSPPSFSPMPRRSATSAYGERWRLN
jgi:hypothetical protein